MFRPRERREGTLVTTAWLVENVIKRNSENLMQINLGSIESENTKSAMEQRERL